MYLRHKRDQEILTAAKLEKTPSFYSWHPMPHAMLSEKQLKYHSQIKVHRGLPPVDMVGHFRQLASEGVHGPDCAFCTYGFLLDDIKGT